VVSFILTFLQCPELITQKTKVFYVLELYVSHREELMGLESLSANSRHRSVACRICPGVHLSVEVKCLNNFDHDILTGSMRLKFILGLV